MGVCRLQQTRVRLVCPLRWDHVLQQRGSQSASCPPSHVPREKQTLAIWILASHLRPWVGPGPSRATSAGLHHALAQQPRAAPKGSPLYPKAKRDQQQPLKMQHLASEPLQKVGGRETESCSTPYRDVLAPTHPPRGVRLSPNHAKQAVVTGWVSARPSMSASAEQACAWAEQTRGRGDGTIWRAWCVMMAQQEGGGHGGRAGRACACGLRSPDEARRCQWPSQEDR